MASWDIDGIDILAGVVAVGFVASAPTPLAALPALILWGGQFVVRRLATDAGMRDKLENSKMPITQHLLPLSGDEEVSTALTIRQDKPIDVNVVNAGDTMNWLQRITRPIEYDGDPAISAQLVTTRGKRNQKVDMLPIALKTMPTYIKHTAVPHPPTSTSVPIGYDGLKKEWHWADFGIDGDVVHALVSGQSGAGKDSVLRLWFTILTALNSPDDIKFVILDGKGEWLTTALLQSKHMLVPPTGGVEIMQDEKGKWYDAANERMEDAVGVIFEEITKRNQSFAKVNATNIQSYYRKTGIKLPVIVVIATDVGTNVEKSFEQLVRLLTFKGRSFGIKLVISMQTVSGQDTGWRNQLGLIMSGFQQAPSADTPTMGINASQLIYRPSQLPVPTSANNRGIFVVRRGEEQVVVKAPHISDEDWEHFTERALPKTGDDIEANSLLQTLLQAPMQKPTIQRQVILTKDQLGKIYQLAKSGCSKTDIMLEMGFTSGPRYKETSPYVDTIMQKARVNNLDV